MELQNPSNGDGGGGGGGGVEDVDSSCSTPYVSAPSSPGRCGASAGWFFSAPASPMHFVLSSQPYSAAAAGGGCSGGGGDADFEFSARFASPGAEPPGSMISADEIFFNGQIRPMKLSSHLQRPQRLAPLLDLDAEEEEDDPVDSASSAEGARGRDLRLRSGSVHRRARSMSPLRNPSFRWHEGEEAEGDGQAKVPEADSDEKRAEGATPSASSSRSSSSSSSSSSSRSSKRWIFLKDLLYRSKSEGRDRVPAKDRFWSSISFSPSSKERLKPSNPPPRPRATAAAAAEPMRTPRAAAAAAGKKASAHERHYAANRAHAEEMRRRTFLPYRQGLLGCLGFSSRGYGAFHGLAKTLNPVSSR